MSKTSPSDVKNILLVGVGAWGTKILRTLQGMDSIADIGLVDKRHDSAMRAQNLAGKSRVFAKLDYALSDRQWDGVIIATQPESRLEVLRSVCKYSFPVLLEKPFALNVEDAGTCAEVAEKAKILVNHLYLFHRDFRRLREVLKKAHLSIKWISSVGGNRGPIRNYSSLWDYGVHDIAMALSLSDQLPLRVSARKLVAESMDGGTAENFSMRLEFANHQADILVGSAFEKRERELTVATERGEFRFVDEISNEYQVLEDAISIFLDGPTGANLDLWGLDLAVNVTKILALAEASLADSSTAKALV
jgi:predicted dehydrogenase